MDPSSNAAAAHAALPGKAVVSGPPVLVSHPLCPYVQRAAIVLEEKSVVFERRDIDLSNKPAWFLKVSPLGKTPVLLVGEQPIFESAVICEYLDETVPPRLHPDDPIDRARDRSYMEVGSSMLNAIGAFYSAPDRAAMIAAASSLRLRLEALETALGKGPYFAGERFGMVDAVFGPVFRYFDVFDQFGDFDFFANLPRLTAWRGALAVRPSVHRAVSPEYSPLLRAFLLKRGSALSTCMAATKAGALRERRVASA